MRDKCVWLPNEYEDKQEEDRENSMMVWSQPSTSKLIRGVEQAGEEGKMKACDSQPSILTATQKGGLMRLTPLASSMSTEKREMNACDSLGFKHTDGDQRSGARNRRRYRRRNSEFV